MRTKLIVPLLVAVVVASSFTGLYLFGKNPIPGQTTPGTKGNNGSTKALLDLVSYSKEPSTIRFELRANNTGFSPVTRYALMQAGSQVSSGSLSTPITTSGSYNETVTGSFDIYATYQVVVYDSANNMWTFILQ